MFTQNVSIVTSNEARARALRYIVSVVNVTAFSKLYLIRRFTEQAIFMPLQFKDLPVSACRSEAVM